MIVVYQNWKFACTIDRLVLWGCIFNKPYSFWHLPFSSSSFSRWDLMMSRFSWWSICSGVEIWVGYLWWCVSLLTSSSGSPWGDCTWGIKWIIIDSRARASHDDDYLIFSENCANYESQTVKTQKSSMHLFHLGWILFSHFMNVSRLPRLYFDK